MQVLQGALSRVLGLHHLRRVFSRLQLREQPLAAAGGPPAPAAAAAAAAAAEAPPAADAAPVAPPAGGLVTAAAALAQARRAVGLTQLLPANATVHTALAAARRTVASMSGRRLVKVRPPGLRGLGCLWRAGLSSNPLSRTHCRAGCLPVAAGTPSIQQMEATRCHRACWPRPALPAGATLGAHAVAAAAALGVLRSCLAGLGLRRYLRVQVSFRLNCSFLNPPQP